MTESLWVIVFAKYPRAGQVNTRLCPPLSLEQAADVQRASLVHVLQRVAGSGRRTILCGTPDEDLDSFRELGGSDITYWPQGSGDLGMRLARATDRAFNAGAPAIVFVGADSPTQPWPAILDALPEQLSRANAVIGPCADGGYYFIALSGNDHRLFDNIDWGSDRVVEQTRERARSAGITLLEAPQGYDVDRIADLERAAADLAHSDPQCPLLDAIHRVLAHGSNPSPAKRR